VRVRWLFSVRTATMWHALEYDFGGIDTVWVKLTDGNQVVE
jgi:hypothetical protein